MKTNHIKWNPSILKRFLIHENNLKPPVKHMPDDKEEHKQADKSCKTYLEPSDDGIDSAGNESAESSEECDFIQESDEEADICGCCQEAKGESDSDKNSDMKNTQYKWKYGQDASNEWNPVMKAKRIKWTPSMLYSFFYPEHGFKDLFKHSSKETHKSPQKDMQKTIITSQESGFDEACNQAAEEKEDKAKTEQEVMANGTKDAHEATSETASNECLDIKPGQWDENSVNIKTESKEDDISVTLKFKIPIGSAKSIEKLEILVNENE